MSLRLLADHCISNAAVRYLEQRGHEVLRLRDHMARDAPDQRVIAKARQLGAILLSLNGDFSDIVAYPPEHYLGIVSLQQRNHPEVENLLLARLGAYLQAHPDSEHYHGKLLVVEPYRIRIRE